MKVTQVCLQNEYKAVKAAVYKDPQGTWQISIAVTDLSNESLTHVSLPEEFFKKLIDVFGDECERY